MPSNSRRNVSAPPAPSPVEKTTPKRRATSSCADLCDARKKNGRVYTPRFIVETILDLTDYRGARIARKHVVDPSCGDGAFLSVVVERYCRENANLGAAKLKAELETFVHGVELDPTEREKCVQNLAAVALTFGVQGVNWDVICADALTVDRFDGRIDFVVGNPPYVRVHNLGATFDAAKRFEFAQTGMTDLFLVFYELGLRMLNRNGVLGYITPSSFFTSVAGRRLREKIVADNLLAKLVDLKHRQVFDAATYSTIVVLTPCRVSDSATQYFEISADDALRPIERLTPADFYLDGRFYFSTRRNLSFLREILTFETLKSAERFAVKNGFATLADAFFIGDAATFGFTDFTIPVVKASTGVWSRSLYPYDAEGRPLPWETLAAVPAVKRYYEIACDRLKQRSLTNPGAWPYFGRTQGLKDVAKIKYAVNTLIRDASDVKLTPSPSGTGVYGGLYVLTDVAFETLRSLLTSDDFGAYVSLLQKYKSGGYYAFSSKDLKMFLERQFVKSQDLTPINH
ncbi:MAG: SAM-dependent DNA methyltransferase [Thermoguttaceae bacterium]|nr:SAM-dependent DNA methyltransferase [Thermoguttaceae bacterium]